MAQLQPNKMSQLKALLKADFTVQLRRGRSGIMTIITPLILVFAFGNSTGKKATIIPPSMIIAASITVGIMGICLAGYSVATAQDRAAGIFQRLRVTPTPIWILMASRLLIQLFVVTIMTILVLIMAYWRLGVNLGVARDILSLGAALFGACSFLALGQLTVALVKSTDAVNSAGRLIYVALTFGGLIGSFGGLGSTFQNIMIWSPYGATETILQAALNGTAGIDHVWWSLLATIAYALVFTAAGIRYFSWATE